MTICPKKTLIKCHQVCFDSHVCERANLTFKLMIKEARSEASWLATFPVMSRVPSDWGIQFK